MTDTQHALTLDDAGLEAAIDMATLRLQTATTPLRRRSAWADLQSLIKQRSPEAVQAMERRRGIAG